MYMNSILSYILDHKLHMSRFPNYTMNYKSKSVLNKHNKTYLRRTTVNK